MRKEGKEEECGLQLHVRPAWSGPPRGGRTGKRGMKRKGAKPRLEGEMRAMTSPRTLRPRPARLPDSGTPLQPLTSRPLTPDPCPLRQAIPRSPQILTRAAPATRTARRAQHRAAQTAGAAVKAQARSCCNHCRRRRHFGHCHQGSCASSRIRRLPSLQPRRPRPIAP